MPTVKKRDLNDDRRELASLDIIKRKVVALKAGLDGDAAVEAVFTPTELTVLRHVARGERVPGVHLTAERARQELQWVSLGGRFPDDD